MIDDKINKKYLFPKKIPKLTSEQKLIKDDFMEHWLKVLRKKYGIVDKFNPISVVISMSKNFLSTSPLNIIVGPNFLDINLKIDFDKADLPEPENPSIQNTIPNFFFNFIFLDILQISFLV